MKEKRNHQAWSLMLNGELSEMGRVWGLCNLVFCAIKCSFSGFYLLFKAFNTKGVWWPGTSQPFRIAWNTESKYIYLYLNLHSIHPTLVTHKKKKKNKFPMPYQWFLPCRDFIFTMQVMMRYNICGKTLRGKPMADDLYAHLLGLMTTEQSFMFIMFSFLKPMYRSQMLILS